MFRYPDTKSCSIRTIKDYAVSCIFFLDLEIVIFAVHVFNYFFLVRHDVINTYQSIKILFLTRLKLDEIILLYFTLYFLIPSTLRNIFSELFNNDFYNLF